MSVRWYFRAVGAAVVAALAFVYLTYLTPRQVAVESRLSEADAKSKAAIDTRLKPLTDLFAKGRKGAKGFSEDALSWNGKWHLVRGGCSATGRPTATTFPPPSAATCSVPTTCGPPSRR